MEATAIRIEDVTVDYHERRALDHLSLQIPTGAIFGLLGPNGAGKTTTLRVLLGLVRPSSGRAWVMGFDTQTHGDEIRQRCGALLELGLYERLSAEDNLRFYGRVWRLPPHELSARVRELLTHVELWERRKEKVSTWSRGMKQRLAITTTLIHEPTLILLDEPTSGLDPIAAATLTQDLIALATRSHASIVLTTHDLPEAERLCTQVGILRDGRLLTLGSPTELREKYGGIHFELIGKGFTPELLARLRQRAEVTAVEQRDQQLILVVRVGADTAPLLTWLVREGAEIAEARRSAGTLEDVFRAVVEEK